MFIPLLTQSVNLLLLIFFFLTIKDSSADNKNGFTSDKECCSFVERPGIIGCLENCPHGTYEVQDNITCTVGNVSLDYRSESTTGTTYSTQPIQSPTVPSQNTQTSSSYFPEVFCVPCDESCNGCFGPGPTNCSQCAPGFHKSDASGISDSDMCSGVVLANKASFSLTTVLLGISMACCLLIIFGALIFYRNRHSEKTKIGTESGTDSNSEREVDFEFPESSVPVTLKMSEIKEHQEKDDKYLNGGDLCGSFINHSYSLNSSISSTSHAERRRLHISNYSDDESFSAAIEKGTSASNASSNSPSPVPFEDSTEVQNQTTNQSFNNSESPNVVFSNVSILGRRQLKPYYMDDYVPDALLPLRLVKQGDFQDSLLHSRRSSGYGTESIPSRPSSNCSENPPDLTKINSDNYGANLLTKWSTASSTQTHSPTTETAPPIISPSWQMSKTISSEGGVVQNVQSDVRLTIPAGAIEKHTTVIISKAVSTDLQKARIKLQLPEDEVIASPVAEFFAGLDFKFKKPVRIQLPHLLPATSVDEAQIKVYRFDLDSEGRIQIDELTRVSREKSQNLSVLENTWFEDAGGLEILLDHFCGVVCTICSKEFFLQDFILDLYAVYRHEEEDQYEVDLHLEIWNNSISDFRKHRENLNCKQMTFMETKKLSALRSLKDANDVRSTKLLVKMELRNPEKQEWMHSERDSGKLVFAEEEIYDLENFILCQDHTSQLPERKDWSLINKLGSKPRRQFQCLIDVGYIKMDDAESSHEKEFLTSPKQVTLKATVTCATRDPERGKLFAWSPTDGEPSSSSYSSGLSLPSPSASTISEEEDTGVKAVASNVTSAPPNTPEHSCEGQTLQPTTGATINSDVITNLTIYAGDSRNSQYNDNHHQSCLQCAGHASNTRECGSENACAPLVESELPVPVQACDVETGSIFV